MSTLDFEAALDTSEDAPDESRPAPRHGVRSPPESVPREESDGREALSKDVIFDVLKNQRRRHVLRYLREHETSTLSDLAEHVAALETDKDVTGLTSNERKRVYVGLYQCHLPRMDNAGVIDYAQARGTIELKDSTAHIFPYLDLDPRDDATGGGRARERLRSLASRLIP